MNNQKQLDLQFGFKKEQDVQPRLEQHFNVKLVKQSGCAIFDYVNDDKSVYIELKARRNTKNQYPTTMVGYNKIVEAIELLKNNTTVYFAFSFTDRLSYYKFNPDTFKNSWIAKGGRCDRGKYEYKQYVYIPVNLLTDIV